MRNQYKVLAEKYSSISEARNVKNRHYSEYDYKRFAQQCFNCDTLDELIRVCRIFYFGDNNPTSEPMSINSYSVRTAVEGLVDPMGLPDGRVVDNVPINSELWSAADCLLYTITMGMAYIRYSEVTPDSGFFKSSYEALAKDHKISLKNAWDVWDEIKETVRHLKQKNKETGINLDI